MASVCFIYALPEQTRPPPQQQQVRLECFLEHEARRLGVRFIMQQPIEVVICGFLFVATILVMVYVQGETSYCFS